MGEFWVFGYGSLMWRPGFPHNDVRKARLFGYHRALCVRSHVHRGTPQRPGLVLGLDRGGSCIGLAFRVDAGDQEATVAYLRERELVTHVYLEKRLGISFVGGGRAEALAYVVDRGHAQYAGALHPDDAARHVNGAVGQSGRNEEYVLNTVDHLRQLGIRDEWLEGVAARLSSSK